MTPLAMEMLIWFFTRPAEAGPFPNINYGPQSEIVQWFLREGIIEPFEDKSPALTYRTTPRGEAWLTMCLETPMPVQVWVDPRKRQPFDLERFMQDDYSLPA